MTLRDAPEPPLYIGEHGERMPGFLREAGQRLNVEAGDMDPMGDIRVSKPLTAA
jgi:hypothetical protein